jgi:hypothetical protein
MEESKFMLTKLLTLMFCIVLSTSVFANTKTVHKFVDKKVAGITIGEYSEEHAFNLYGKGIPIQEGYAFCYYNKKQGSFLIFEYGTDKFIESGIIVKQDYEKHHEKCKEKEIAGNLQTGKGIKLGDSPKSVILVYGEPDKKEIKDGILIFEYHTDFRKDPRVTLAYDAYLHFKGGKLVKISIHDGD